MATEAQKRAYDKYRQTDKGKAVRSNESAKKSKSAYNKSDKGRLAAHGQRLRRYYGISIDEYNAILDKQNGVCAICKQLCPTGKGYQLTTTTAQV